MQRVLLSLVASLIATSSRATAEPSPIATSPPAQLAAQIKDYLAAEAQSDRFSGVVLLAQHGQVIFGEAYGLASKEYGARNTIETRFNLGSINKLMTRIAIVQLAAQGKLSSEDTISKLLPDYPNKAAAKVTVRQLLEMSSGIGDFFGPAYQATTPDRLRTLADFVPLFANKPLAFPPGTSQAYSNGGFIVLGLIIERLSGLSYYDFVQHHIFDSAGMTASGWFERDVPTPNVATGYTKPPDKPTEPWRNNIYTTPARGSSAGGGYSNAPDLLKLADALEQGKLLDAERTAAVLGPGIGIAGGSPGVNADLEIDPRSGYTLIVLSNYDPPSAERIARQIRQWIGL